MDKDIQLSAATLRNNLMVISNWAFQWKINFNSDLTKQAQEVVFRRKTKKLLHPSLTFKLACVVYIKLLFYGLILL